MMRGFRTLMVSDGNAAPTDAEHNAALATFLLLFGDVQTTDELIGRLERGASQAAAD
jgi:ureidoacrylate peracid hydrolase